MTHMTQITRRLGAFFIALIPLVAYAEISHDGQVWQRTSTTGLNNIYGAGQYVFRVNPGPLVKSGAQIRVVVPYSVGISIA